jgi:hypothetical protein
MSNNILPYGYAFRTEEDYIEILPVGLLPQRKRWQQTAGSLPVGTCLLVADPNDSRQMRTFQRLARSFRKRGRKAIVWTKHLG